MVCSLWSYKRLAQGLLAFLGMVLLLALGACSMPTAQPKDSASKLIATNPAANPAADPAVDLTGNPRIAAVLAQPPHVLLLGEQHDAPDHPALHADVVQRLIASGQLAALVLEMADTGKDTRAVPKTGADADVQAALAWNTQAWDWSRYAPSVLAAVRAGVPVLGANLPRGAPASSAASCIDTLVRSCAPGCKAAGRRLLLKLITALSRSKCAACSLRLKRLSEKRSGSMPRVPILPVLIWVSRLINSIVACRRIS